MAGYKQASLGSCGSGNNIAPTPDHARLQNMFDALLVVRDTTTEQVNRLRNSMDFVLGSEPEQAGSTCEARPPQAMAEQIREVFLQIGANLQAINAQIVRVERVTS